VVECRDDVVEGELVGAARDDAAHQSLTMFGPRLSW
jgi:hypothetical protein